MTSQPARRNQRLLLTSQQLDTVLAALRYWQMSAENGRIDPSQDSIATDSGEALPVAQYDEFIQSINGAGAEHGTLLDAVTPVLRTSERVEIRVHKDGEALHVLLIPKLAEATDDDDAGVAAFRALLARPLKAVIPAGEDADAHLSVLLANHAAMRDEVSGDLDEHRKLLDQAREEAKQAREKAAADAKAKSATKAPSKSTKDLKRPKPAKPTEATKGAEPPDADAEAEAESDTDAGSGTDSAPEAPAPAPGRTGTLFDNLGY